MFCKIVGFGRCKERGQLIGDLSWLIGHCLSRVAVGTGEGSTVSGSDISVMSRVGTWFVNRYQTRAPRNSLRIIDPILSKTEETLVNITIE